MCEKHALSCKKGGFISIRHNEIRNMITRLLKEVYKDIRAEPQLQHLTGKTHQSSTFTRTEVHLDICARDFFNPKAERYVNQKISKTYDLNDKEKKFIQWADHRNWTCKFYSIGDVSYIEWVNNVKSFTCV